MGSVFSKMPKMPDPQDFEMPDHFPETARPEFSEITDTELVDPEFFEDAVAELVDPEFPEDAVAEYLDERQAHFHKLGGNASQWTPPFHVYLNINDVPISTPSPKDAYKFRCVSSDSLDATFSIHGNWTDFASVVVKLFTHDLGFDDAYAGQIRIWAKDIVEVTTKEHNEDAQEALKRFCPEA